MEEELKSTIDVPEGGEPIHETDTMSAEARGEIDWGPDVGGEVLTHYDAPN